MEYDFELQLCDFYEHLRRRTPHCSVQARRSVRLRISSKSHRRATQALLQESGRHFGGAEDCPNDIDLSPLTNNKRLRHLSIVASNLS
jgi:hypothetical protein